MRDELTDRQKLFCEYYAANPNGTAAALQAGYSKRTAAQLASKLLKNHKVLEYLNRLQTAQAGERIANAAEVQSVMTIILRDASKPPSARIRAGEMLLRAGGQFGPPDEPLPDEGDGVQIAMPWTARDGVLHPFNAVCMQDGSIVPLAESEDEPVLFAVNLFSPKAMREFWDFYGIKEDTE